MWRGAQHVGVLGRLRERPRDPAYAGQTRHSCDLKGDDGEVFGLIVLGIFAVLIFFAYLLDRSARKRGHRLRSGRALSEDFRNNKRAVRRGPLRSAKDDAQKIYEQDKARRNR